MLVRLDAVDAHEFISDLDPWLLEGSVAQKPKWLPKPRGIRGLPIREWVQNLSEAVTWKVRERDGAVYCYYVPHLENWEPEEVDKPTWRAGVFPVGSKVIRGGRVSGPLDRDNRVWSWDDVQEKHWDVQHPDEKVLDKWDNVSHTGRLLAER
jgi:hypothetical protein